MPRTGLAGALGLWIVRDAWTHSRVELGFGGYSLLGGGLLCPAVYPSDCGGPGGFPEMLTLSADMMLGRPSQYFATVGVTAIHGYGNKRRTDRDALAPEVGAGVALGKVLFCEARYRWLPQWEGERFRSLSLTLGWRGR